MKRVATILSCLFIFWLGYSQTTGNPNTGDAHFLFGPNTSWGQYLKIGGNGRETTHASVVATNGNLHLDSRNGAYSTYINHYGQGNTILNSQAGNVGIGTTNPTEKLEIKGKIYLNAGPDDDGIYWARHNMTMGTIPGSYNHNVFKLKPGGSSSGYLYSIFEMYKANSENDHEKKVQIHSSGNSFLNGGNVGIGTNMPSARLEIQSPSSTDESDMIIYSSSTVSNTAGWSRLSLKRINEPNQGFLSFYGNNSSGLILGVSGNNPIRFFNNELERVRIANNGNVGIGTVNPDSKLTVKGNIHTQEVKVDLNGAVAPDYVFKEDYHLKTLEEVQEYIQEKGHLPNIPSAREMKENGVLLKEMNLKLLEKIEELTLYTLEQEKELNTKEQMLKRTVTELEKIKSQMEWQEIRLQKLEQFLNQ